MRAGGSVVVNSAGAVTITPASGQHATVVLDSGGSGEFRVQRLDGVRYLSVSHQTGVVTVQNLVAQGAGTHPFSGPVQSSGNPGFKTTAALAAYNILEAYSGTDRRFIAEYNNGATVFYAVIGAGAGTATEAYRILSSAYMQVQTRLGIGASPTYPLHVVGRSYFNDSMGVGIAPNSYASAALTVGYSITTMVGGYFRQEGASATVPVVVVKLGATPLANAQEWQDSTGSVVLAIHSTGRFNITSANTATTVGAAGAASALPANPDGYIMAYVGGAEKKIPYYAT